MNTSSQGAKLEIELVLRETCDRVLSAEPSPAPQSSQGRPYSVDHAAVSRGKLHMRAVALQIMGDVRVLCRQLTDVIVPKAKGYIQAFMAVQKDGHEDAEYIRVGKGRTV